MAEESRSRHQVGQYSYQCILVDFVDVLPPLTVAVRVSWNGVFTFALASALRPLDETVSVKTPLLPFARRYGALVRTTLIVFVTFFVMVHCPDFTLTFLVVVICPSDLTSPEHVALAQLSFTDS